MNARFKVSKWIIGKKRETFKIMKETRRTLGPDIVMFVINIGISGARWPECRHLMTRICWEKMYCARPKMHFRPSEWNVNSKSASWMATYDVTWIEPAYFGWSWRQLYSSTGATFCSLQTLLALLATNLDVDYLVDCSSWLNIIVQHQMICISLSKMAMARLLQLPWWE